MRPEMRNISISMCLIIALFGCSESKGVKETKRPNIIIILADDMGYGDPEVYNAASKIPTPHINNLAKNGLRFTDAHSPSSVCSPTRYGLLTGQYAWRTALKKSVLWMWDRPLIDQNRITMPKMLKQYGYETACIGKWHLGWNWPNTEGQYVNSTIEIGDYGSKERIGLGEKIDFSKPLGGGPIGAGFDYYFGDDVPNFAPYAFFENDKLLSIPTMQKPKEMFGGDGPMVPGWDLTEVMPAITSKAVSYIEKSANKEAPFFLYFPLTAPHTPIAPHKEFIGSSKAGRYGDYVHQVDATVGAIVNALKQTGQLENTLIVFTSDNGSPQRDGTDMGGAVASVKAYNHDPSGGLKGLKSDIWEGGHRVPFIVSWPAKMGKGAISEQLIGINDLMATFKGLLENDDKEHYFEDSVDFSSVFLKNTKESVREDLVHHSISGMFSIREGAWKLIEGQGSGGWSKDADAESIADGQLYNLDNDVSETNNLYNEHPEIVKHLKEKLKRYRQQGYSNERYQN